jgi:hypothetical protein
MRGMGHSDPIETVALKHEEGNEGVKIGVKRRIAAFYGGKLLKRQGEGLISAPYPAQRLFKQIVDRCDLTAPTETAVQAGIWTRYHNQLSAEINKC